jgi:CHAD domain-containing protein
MVRLVHLSRHPVSDRQKWKNLRDQVQDTLREAIGDDQWEQNNPNDLWRENEDLRKVVRRTRYLMEFAPPLEEVWQAMLLPDLGVRAIRTSTLPMLTHFTTVRS